MDAHEVATVEAWHRLLNSGDVERLTALVDPNVEIGGPRGTSRGRDVFRAWFGRAGVELIPLRYFHKGRVVVAEEDGRWHAPSGGGATGRGIVASVFTVDGDAITSIRRFDDLRTALVEAGLEASDAVE